MANTCFNELRFTGDSHQVMEANLFLANSTKDKWGGTTPEGTDCYFQDIDFCQGKFLFGTRWQPDLETVKAIADRFRVGFVLDYFDPMMSLYGQARYDAGKLIDTRLSADDYAKADYSQGNAIYKFQQKIYRNYEALSFALLKDKIKVEQALIKQKQQLKIR